NRRHLYRAGRRHDPRRHDRSHPARPDWARRVSRRLCDRQRLQDGRSRQRRARRAGSPEPCVQGIRSVVGVAAGYRLTRGCKLLLETTGTLMSTARPFRVTFTVAVDPIFASATFLRNCEGSSTLCPLNPTITSPGRSPASYAGEFLAIRLISAPLVLRAPSSWAACSVSFSTAT